jgi:sulfatase modifying factor 1
MHVWTSIAHAGALLLNLHAEPSMVPIAVGPYRPAFAGENDPKEVMVASFQLAATPVTNRDFLEFVRVNPRWRRSQVKRLFADENYLKHWADDTSLGAGCTPDQPVTWVSWFAAKAFASWKGGRLPTPAEWERTAAAGFNQPNGSADPEFLRALARWYTTPTAVCLPAVGASRPNYLGVRDLHGLVWEWTSDFNSATVTGDARGDTGLERQLFCGAGSVGATNPNDYATFMRIGFRSSLKAAYTVHNLGFRYAKNP